MENRLATLKCKEVVNICDGCRLGYVCDVELDLISGRIIALLLPGPAGFSAYLDGGMIIGSPGAASSASAAILSWWM